MYSTGLFAQSIRGARKGHQRWSGSRGILKTDTQVTCGWAQAVRNRSPKGNMWSVIPVALLFMVINWNKRKQGSSSEGDKVLYNTGFLFVRPSIRQSFSPKPIQA